MIRKGYKLCTTTTCSFCNQMCNEQDFAGGTKVARKLASQQPCNRFHGKTKSSFLRLFFRSFIIKPNRWRIKTNLQQSNPSASQNESYSCPLRTFPSIKHKLCQPTNLTTIQYLPSDVSGPRSTEKVVSVALSPVTPTAVLCGVTRRASPAGPTPVRRSASSISRLCISFNSNCKLLLFSQLVMLQQLYLENSDKIFSKQKLQEFVTHLLLKHTAPN